MNRVRQVKEKYDPNGPVCDNQADFNQAFNNAVTYTNNQNMPSKTWMAVYLGMWMLFVIWGIMLAMRIGNAVERTEHVVFAIVFGPAYVLAYYVSGMSNKGKFGMGGSCGMRN